MMYFKDDPRLAGVRLKPRHGLAVAPDPASMAHRLARVYNRIGGLLTCFSTLTAIDVTAALAVWCIESAGLPFVRGRPVLRFENHKFFSLWGRSNEDSFDAHFQFGGRLDTPGKPWEQHRFRPRAMDDWRRFHGDQDAECAVFECAARLAGREAACQSASFGGPQIMGFNHAVIGYASARDLYAAFSRSERWQVCGFFDFCQAKALIEPIRQQRWLDFAAVYNGPGNAKAYEARLTEAVAEARALL